MLKSLYTPKTSTHRKYNILNTLHASIDYGQDYMRHFNAFLTFDILTSDLLFAEDVLRTYEMAHWILHARDTV